MRLAGLLMVKNEIDILEYNIRHNLQFLDMLFIIDNGSIDGTRELLSKMMSEEKLPIVIYDDPGIEYFQSEKMTNLTFNIDHFFQPDFMFLLDADEFISAKSREHLENILTLLEYTNNQNPGIIKWHTYVVTPNDEENASTVFERMKYRRLKENPQFYKVVIKKDFSKNLDNGVLQGNHFIYNLQNNQITHHILPELAIAHFPVRSTKQLKQKVILGWLAYLAKKQKGDEGYHWKQIYDLIFDGKLTKENLIRISRNYSQKNGILDDYSPEDIIYDPFNCDIKLQYDNTFEKDEVFIIVKSMEKNFLKENLINDKNTLGHYIDWSPFKYIAEKYKPESVLEIGCGSGANIKLFRNTGVQDSFGIDLTPYNDNFICDARQYQCLPSYDNLYSPKNYDLIVCTELIQSLNKETQDGPMNFMTSNAKKRIVFSFALPGQIGKNCLNSYSSEYWIEYFDKLGWKLNGFDSLAFRSLASYPWFRRNSFIFERKNDINDFSKDNYGEKELLNLSHKTFKWNSYSPKFYTYPLSENIINYLKCYTD